MLKEMVANPKEWEREELPEYTEAYMALLLLESEQDVSHFMEIGEGLLYVLDLYGKQMKEECLAFLLLFGQLSTNPLWGAQESELAEKILEKIQEITKDLEPEMQEFIQTAQTGMALEKLENDQRFGKTMRIAAEAFYIMPQDELFDAYTKKFALTDTKLCMIMEREEILKQAEILKQEYGFLYEEIEPFIRKLSDEKNIGLLKERLLKDYQRMYPEFGEGFFAENYPQEMRRFTGTSFYEGDMPYIREGKKIGRNDPCPCGSGKKYKQCCGKK